MSGKQPNRKVKKLKVKDVATTAKAISSPKEDLSTEIVCKLKKRHHIDLFSDCRQLVEILKENLPC